MNESFRSYLVRHWRGELQLVESFWRIGFGGGLLLGIVEYIVVMAVGGGPAVLRPMLISFTFINAAFLIWVGVGIWRSARRYEDSRFLAVLAQATVVIGGAGFVLDAGLRLAVLTGLLRGVR